LEHTLRLVQYLTRIASALWQAKLSAAGLPIARQAAALNSSCARFPTRGLGFTLALAANAASLAGPLKHPGEHSADLQQADLARRLYERAAEADPDSVHWPIALTGVWTNIGKVRWDLGRADLALAAFRESTRIQRQLFEADSSSAFHRYNLDRC